MLDKLKRFIINMMCFIWMSGMCMIASMGSIEDEATVASGLISIAVWILSLIILIKISPVVSAVVSTIAAIVVNIVAHGVNTEQYQSLLESLAEPIGQIIAVVLFIWIIFSLIGSHKEEEDARETRKKKARERGEAHCPNCGSISIQYYPLGVPFESRYYDEDGIERTGIGHYAYKYHCNNCGHMWRL